MREAFRELVEQWATDRKNPPERAKFEENYEPREEPLDDFLRRFLTCDDALPSDHREAVRSIIGLPASRAATYSTAAHELIVLIRQRWVSRFRCHRCGAAPPELEDGAPHLARYAGWVDPDKPDTSVATICGHCATAEEVAQRETTGVERIIEAAYPMGDTLTPKARAAVAYLADEEREALIIPPDVHQAASRCWADRHFLALRDAAGEEHGDLAGMLGEDEAIVTEWLEAVATTLQLGEGD
jgi:hypothetical protein